MLLLFFLSAVLVLSFSPKLWAEGSSGFYGFQVLKFLGMIGYVIYLTYFQLIDLTFTAWLSHIGWIIAILWIIDFFITIDDTSAIGLVQMTVGVISLLGFAYILIFYPMSIANDKYKVVEGTKKETTLPQTDEDNIVSVPYPYAKYKAEKLIGELENYSYYDLGVYSIQKIGDKLMFVTPVEYSDFSTWNKSGKKIPGYIQVDALDENAPAEFVPSKMKYVPSAYFGDNLIRKVRKEYPNVIILESSFEPDDNGKPFYVVTYAHYKKFRAIPKVDGVILVDPATGKTKKFEGKDTPKFVDQFIPADDISSVYNEWYGKYHNGWLNSWWGKKDVKKPTDWGTGSEVAAVFDNDGEMSWFTDFTTLNENASSMVGYSLMHARTGEFTYYTGKNANGLINGNSAIQVVNKTFTKDKWYGTQPMLYNIYGEMTWFIPIIDADGLLRSYALVNAKDPKVIAAETTKQKAFESYKRLIVTKLNGANVKPGKGIDIKKVAGKVFTKETVAKGDDIIIFIQIDNDKQKVYQISMDKNPFAIGLKIGQEIEVTYLDTEEPVVELQGLTIK